MSKWHTVKVKIKVIRLSTLHYYLYFYKNNGQPHRLIRPDLNPKIIFDQIAFSSRVKCSLTRKSSNMAFSLSGYSMHHFYVKCKSADDALLLKMIYT